MEDAASEITTNHEGIKKWVEERGGEPSIVKGTGGNGAGVLRINFPGYTGNNLEEISWKEFFKIFDEKGLAFLHQDTTASGQKSNFNKFVSRR